MQWIDKIPILLLVVLAGLLAVVPMHEGSHLLEKSRMLFNGELIKPIDIFDLFMHGTPSVLLVIRLIRLMRKSGESGDK